MGLEPLVEFLKLMAVTSSVSCNKCRGSCSWALDHSNSPLSNDLNDETGSTCPVFCQFPSSRADWSDMTTVTRMELELLEMELDTQTHSCHGRHVTLVVYMTRVQGLPISDCARGCINRGYRWLQLSAIDVTEKTFFKRLYLVLRLRKIALCVRLSVCSHNSDRFLDNYFSISEQFFPLNGPSFCWSARFTK